MEALGSIPSELKGWNYNPHLDKTVRGKYFILNDFWRGIDRFRDGYFAAPEARARKKELTDILAQRWKRRAGSATSLRCDLSSECLLH